MNKLFTVTNISPNRAAQIFFHIKFDKSGCWLWTKSVNSDGYGYTSLHHKTVYIHRFMYAWLIKPIPAWRGKKIQVLDHLCNTPRCCNPAHLVLVLPRENVLRSNAPPAINAKKIFCKRGHRLSPPHPVTGRRRCLECAKIRRQIKSFNPRQFFFAPPRDGAKLLNKPR